MYKEILESLIEPIVFCDLDHVIVYMNGAALKKYEKRGGKDLLGRSIFDCHNESSNSIIIEIFESMLGGLDEQMIADNEKTKIFMRAVRDENGQLIGYYERFESKSLTQ